MFGRRDFSAPMHLHLKAPWETRFFLRIFLYSWALTIYLSLGLVYASLDARLLMRNQRLPPPPSVSFRRSWTGGALAGFNNPWALPFRAHCGRCFSIHAHRFGLVAAASNFWHSTFSSSFRPRWILPPGTSLRLCCSCHIRSHCSITPFAPR